VYKVSVPAIFLISILIIATGCGGGGGNSGDPGGGGVPGINVVVITPSGPAAVDGGQATVLEFITADEGEYSKFAFR